MEAKGFDFCSFIMNNTICMKVKDNIVIRDQSKSFCYLKCSYIKEVFGIIDEDVIKWKCINRDYGNINFYYYYFLI